MVEIKGPHAARNKTLCDSFDEYSFLTKTNDKITLKKKHKYYTQIITLMALTGSTRGYFVVWTQNNFLVELINFDKEHWESNLEVFFKQYMVKALLNIEPLTYCGKCEKVLLNENEISEMKKKKRTSVVIIVTLISTMADKV